MSQNTSDLKNLFYLETLFEVKSDRAFWYVVHNCLFVVTMTLCRWARTHSTKRSIIQMSWCKLIFKVAKQQILMISNVETSGVKLPDLSYCVGICFGTLHHPVSQAINTCTMSVKALKIHHVLTQKTLYYLHWNKCQILIW